MLLLMIYLIIWGAWIAVVYLCAKTAMRKGRSPVLWAILGVLFPVISLIAVHLLPAAGPNSNDRGRSAPARSHQHQAPARPSTPRQKPRPHRGQEVPALLDGNKRDD